MKTLPRIASLIICFCSITPLLRAQVPSLINYQGRVLAGSTNFDGSGQFKFALVNTNGTTTYWSNNGSSSGGSEPSAAVTLTVTKGLYSVLLGDTSIANMTVAVPSSVFTNSDVRLRVWFNDGTHGSQLLAPDQRIAAVGYTFMADNIKDNAITTAKIATGAVGSSQLGSSLTLAGTTTGTFSGSGSALVNLNASNISTGVIANASTTGTSANTPNTLVLRDPSGSFSAATISSSLLSSGSVGVGTATPAKPLDVTASVAPLAVGGSVDPSVIVRLTNSANTGSVSTPNVIGIGFGRSSTQQAIIGGTFGNDYLDFFTGAALTAPKMRIASNGNVGIGTSTPTAALDVAGTVKGTSFSGNGSALTNLSAANLSGTLPALNGSALTNLNASNITPAVARLAGGNSFTGGTQTITFDGTTVRSQAASAGISSFMDFADSTGGTVFRGIIGADGFGFSGATNQFSIATWTNSPLAFYTNQARRMTIDGNGLVGIGTATPTHAQLEIGTAAGSWGSGSIFPGFSSANTSGFLTNYPAQSGLNAAIYANGIVVTTTNFAAISDERIKNIIGRSDGVRDLDTLLGIEITDYRYKDVIAHGDAPSKKVIAQQVEKIFPQAVNKQTGEVPDIYKLATIKDGWIALATDLKKGERVKLITDEAQAVYEVLEVRDGAFRTDFKSATGKVFVYGREVKDFRNVDYDAIAMLNVSATQEMQREIECLQANLGWQNRQFTDLRQQDESQLAALRNENAKLREQNIANAKRLAALETRDKEREARLTRLEISMPAAQPVANTIASGKAGGQ